MKLKRLFRRATRPIRNWLEIHFPRPIKVKIKTSRFVDRCDLMHMVMFKVLDDFLVKECGPECIVDWDSDDQHRNAMSTMRNLNDWYKNTYTNFDEYGPYDETQGTPMGGLFKKKEETIDGQVAIYYRYEPNEYDKQYYGEASKKREAIEQELITKMKQLVDISSWLWT